MSRDCHRDLDQIGDIKNFNTDVNQIPSFFMTAAQKFEVIIDKHRKDKQTIRHDSELAEEAQKYSEEYQYTGGRHNVTPADTLLLVYNRVPKSGSTGMRNLLQR